MFHLSWTHYNNLFFCISFYPTQVKIMRINENSASLLNTMRNRAISAAFTSTCSSKVTLCLKIIYWDRNKSFKVIRMSIEDYYLVPIKNLPRLCKYLVALKHLNKWTETGCTLNRMWYASLTMQRIHQLGLWQMRIFRSNASIFVDFIWLIFDVKFIEISVKMKWNLKSRNDRIQT